MPDVLRTRAFADWLRGLRDDRAKARISLRIDRLVIGHEGDTKSVGAGGSELRIDYGPGYRIYFTRRGDTLVILLCGGDKSSQRRDIACAKALATGLEDGKR